MGTRRHERKTGRRARALALASTLALVVAGCGGGSPGRKASPPATTTTSTATTSTTPAPSTTAPRKSRRTSRKAKVARKRRQRHVQVRAAYHGPALCPLNGLPAPGGHAPRRAALAVKVENLPQARPQWGLDTADIVFEEPVEGGITRFIVVFDCYGAPRIEPVRSARLIDPGLLEPMGRILFAYSGAIQPVVDEIDAPTSLLEDVGGYKAPNAYWRDPNRYVPHNLVSSTAALYSAAAALHYPQKPPTPIFSYGPPGQGATPAAGVAIHFPIDTVTWQWDRQAGVYYRSYSDTGPATLGDGKQISASNVVVMLMHEYVTKYSEDPLGAHENGLILRGSDPVWVLRDGLVLYGHWERGRLDQPYVFIQAKTHQVIHLTPGNTWVELVPDGTDVAVQP